MDDGEESNKEEHDEETNEEEEYERVFGEYEHVVFKWVADGAKTWDEVVKKLKSEIIFIEELRDAGCEMHEEVNNGYLSYSIPEEKRAMFREKWQVDEEEK